MIFIKEVIRYVTGVSGELLKISIECNGGYMISDFITFLAKETFMFGLDSRSATYHGRTMYHVDSA